MKLTLIKGSDNRLFIDGIGYEIDTSVVPENIHAIQWDGQKGWIEYIPDPVTGIKPPNEAISSLEEFESHTELLKFWEVEHEKYNQYLKDVEYNPKRLNKSTAKTLLAKTDWVEFPSVNDPKTKPTLTNKAEFDEYRAKVRSIAIDPPETLHEFPAAPAAVWSK
jgi:hypothetical protein